MFLYIYHSRRDAMTQRFYLSLLIIIALSLSACQQISSTVSSRPDSTAEIAAQTAERSGDYLSASLQYLNLAKVANEPQKSQFNLRAALAFWQLTQLEQVAATLADVDRSVLSQSQQLDAAMLDANLALINSQPEQALAVIFPFDLSYTSPTQKQQALKLKIQAYALTKNWLEKANSHIMLEPLLANSEQAQNQQLLWSALMSLTDQALDLFNPGIPPAVDSGWFALAYLVKTYSTKPEIFTVALEDWKRNYPNHPASPELYQQSVAIGTKQLQNLTDIAILLPETGPYKVAADAIKRGILAAHFNSKSNTRLHFFAVDTDQQTGLSNVLQKYQHAIELHAGLVIGPLDKESVQILADADNLAIPVLALNRLADDTSRQNLFQFGLAPEDEAVAVADYAVKQNYKRALVLAPKNEWGSRIATAFSNQWLRNGGILLNQANYNPQQNDFAATIKPLLGLEASEQRYNSLKSRLGISLAFEARRRQDIDFIFLVAKPLKARQLVPQLKFHRSGQLPIIATSHVYEGYDDSQQNIDLNNLILSDMPWVFNNLTQSDPTYITLRNDSSHHFDESVRLYALGADAYHLIPELNQLNHSAEFSFNGATGVLSINASGQVIRKPRWAKFNHGLIELLALPELLTTVP
ncbi:MAG: outer membrane PBP1 activator LpoA protein [Methylophagaceae bacterium]|jgi:outer membrane PBP1 activator LpoA protein